MAALAAAMCFSQTGCSVLLMDKPPDEVGEAYPECSDGPGAPIADIALAAIWGLIGFGFWSDIQDHEGSIENGERNALVTAGAITVLHAGSAAFGARWMTDCAQKRALWERNRVRYTRPSDSRPAEPAPVPPVSRPPRGSDGEPCYPNGTCNVGFTCDLASSTCRARARPPATPPAQSPATPPAPPPAQ